MEIVWKSIEGRWHHAVYILPGRNIVGQKQIYNIDEVVGIDSYEHVSKKTSAQFNISIIQEKIGTTDFYIKFGENDIPQKTGWICKTCVKLCKSKIVTDCNYYKGPMEVDSWRV